MSLLLAHFGHGAMSDLSPLSGVERKFDLEAVRSALDPGCVKTPTFNPRVEIPSRFRKFENQKCLRPLLRQDDRENNSAHSWLVNVFTKPMPIGDIVGCSPKPSLGNDVTCQWKTPLRLETDLCEGQKTAHLLELGCVHSHLQ